MFRVLSNDLKVYIVASDMCSTTIKGTSLLPFHGKNGYGNATHCYVNARCLSYLQIRHNADSTQNCSGDQIEENEVGGACSTYGGEQKCTQGFGVET